MSVAVTEWLGSSDTVKFTSERKNCTINFISFSALQPHNPVRHFLDIVSISWQLPCFFFLPTDTLSALKHSNNRSLQETHIQSEAKLSLNFFWLEGTKALRGK